MRASHSKISPLFSVFLFVWITLNHHFFFKKRRKLHPSFLHATRHFLDFVFSLGFISGFNNHLINIHLKKISRKIPKLAQLYPEYIIIFIIKILGYFWGFTKNVSEYQKGKNIEKDNKSDENRKMVTNLCYRCGMKGHWSRTCRTPKHLVDLYQESLKKKDKKAVETNFVSKDDSVDHDLNDMTHLDIVDFFIQPEANIEHLFGDENLQK